MATSKPARRGSYYPQRPPRPAMIGERVAKVRQRLGLRQQDLATKAELTMAQLSRIENNAQDVRGAVIVRLARSLGCSMDFLCGLRDRE